MSIINVYMSEGACVVENSNATRPALLRGLELRQRHSGVVTYNLLAQCCEEIGAAHRRTDISDAFDARIMYSVVILRNSYCGLERSQRAETRSAIAAVLKRGSRDVRGSPQPKIRCRTSTAYPARRERGVVLTISNAS